MKILNITVLCLAAVGLLGCGFTPNRQESPLREEVRQFHVDRVQYYTSEYEQHGSKNPDWDKAMHTLIKEYHRWIYQPSSPLPQPLLDVLEKLDKAKCAEPYFLLISADLLHHRATQPYPYASYEKAYNVLRKTSYGPVTQYLAAHNAARFGYHPTDPVKRGRFLALQAEAFEHLLKAVEDTSIPSETFAHSAALFISWSRDADEPQAERSRRYQRLTSSILRHRPQDALMLRLRGYIEISKAWDARGSNWAYTVTPAGWAGFKTHLEAAEKLLSQSWEIKPTVVTAEYMMTIARGLKRDREQMELWFTRAMELNPESVSACYHKLTYLEPRWHGTHKERFAFGSECAENSKWGGHVPLVLAFVVQNYVESFPPSEREQIRKKPEIWALVKKSYATYLKRHPTDERIRHEFLERAHEHSAWDDFEEQWQQIKAIKLAYIPQEKLTRMMDDFGRHKVSLLQGR